MSDRTGWAPLGCLETPREDFTVTGPCCGPWRATACPAPPPGLLTLPVRPRFSVLSCFAALTVKLFLGSDLRRGQVRQALAALLQAAPVGHVDTLIVSTLGNEAVDAPDEGKTGREAFPDGFLDAFLPVYEVRPIHSLDGDPAAPRLTRSAAFGVRGGSDACTSQEMEELHAEGKVRRLGITNFSLAQMQAFISMVKVRTHLECRSAWPGLPTSPCPRQCRVRWG